MKCQSLFSGKNKKNILKWHLLKFLPRVLSTKKFICQNTICRLNRVFICLMLLVEHLDGHFLAHLSQSLSMSCCDHQPSVVHLSTPLNDFSFETPRPIFFKFHVEPSVKGGLKIYTNGHGSLIKMAVMPIYGKNT